MEDLAFSFAGAPARLAGPALLEKQATALRRTQDELIDEVQQIADRWCARRHESVEAAFDLRVASMNYADPGQGARTWMRFCVGAMQRLTEDAFDHLHLGVAFAKTCGDGLLARPVEQTTARRRPVRAAAARKRSKTRRSRARRRRA